MGSDWTRRLAWKGLCDVFCYNIPTVLWYDEFKFTRVRFFPLRDTFELHSLRNNKWTLVSETKCATATTPSRARAYAKTLLQGMIVEPFRKIHAVSNRVGARHDGRLVTVKR
jgi:hypothetical protein